jgi:hypothetical protein
MGLSDDTRCLVDLSQKVKGHTIYCGIPLEICPRQKHQELQTVPLDAGVRKDIINNSRIQRVRSMTSEEGIACGGPR